MERAKAAAEQSKAEADQALEEVRKERVEMEQPGPSPQPAPERSRRREKVRQMFLQCRRQYRVRLGSRHCCSVEVFVDSVRHLAATEAMDQATQELYWTWTE